MKELHEVLEAEAHLDKKYDSTRKKNFFTELDKYVGSFSGSCRGVTALKLLPLTC